MTADHWAGDCGDVVTALESDGLPYFVPQRYFLGIPSDPAEYTATARGTA